MKKSTFSPAQIAGILKEFENGKTAEEITRDHGVSKAALYKWRQRYGGMEASDVKKMKDLEEENAKLKRIVANLTLENDAIKTVLEKKYGGPGRQTGGGKIISGRKDFCSPGLQDCSHRPFIDHLPAQTKRR